MTKPPATFPPSRAAGLARFAQFLPNAGRDYANERNYDRPEDPTVSLLSPYLRHRIVTEPEVLAEVHKAHGHLAAKFVDEVHWRAYWKGFLEMRPGLWRAYQRGVTAGLNRLATEAGLRKTFDAACNGTTGIDGFDHWARDLVAMGYLHNHARMWFASIWIFTLRLPWELGADFFMRHLLDGDPASNTLSWRWVAGLHTPGKTYLATADNIARHTGGRFAPKGLAPAAHPVQGTPNPAAGPCPQGGLWPHDLPTALLLHEDDLSPDWLLDGGLNPVETAFLIAPEGRSPLTPAPHISDFLRGAVDDCKSRLGAQLGGMHGPVMGEAAVDALVAWARTAEVRQIVTPFAPVGPVADRLDELEKRLAVENIPLIRAMRDYDARAWPLATHGFFRFREGMA